MIDERCDAPRAAEARAALGHVPVPCRNVLVVTADGRDPHDLAGHVRAAGFPPLVGPATQDTLDALIADPPALVVADLGTEDTRVLDLVSALASALAMQAPPVIALAERDDEATVERAFAAGARDVLSRTELPAVLRVKLHRHARRLSSRPARIGPFEIVSVLGRGGMGTVFLARAGTREVALKVLEIGAGTSEAFARFRREVDVLRGLRCDRVPRFVDAGRVDECVYLAMEYVPGETLGSIVDRGPLAPDRALRILDEVATALIGIHAAGLVHRDVKPTNVIVAPGVGAKLVDLGLAKALDDGGLTRHDEVLGTVYYMSPELVRGEGASPSSDAYALGVTILEAILGSCPLRGTPFDVGLKVAEGKVPRASVLAPHLAPGLRALLDGLLASDPAKRLDLVSARAQVRAIS